MKYFVDGDDVNQNRNTMSMSLLNALPRHCENTVAHGTSMRWALAVHLDYKGIKTLITSTPGLVHTDA